MDVLNIQSIEADAYSVLVTATSLLSPEQYRLEWRVDYEKAKKLHIGQMVGINVVMTE